MKKILRILFAGLILSVAGAQPVFGICDYYRNGWVEKDFCKSPGCDASTGMCSCTWAVRFDAAGKAHLYSAEGREATDWTSENPQCTNCGHLIFNHDGAFIK